jgi:hypothetical protein
MRCEPANTIIQKFGGLSALAEVVGKASHTVMKWRMPKPQGTGGVIPHWHHEAILAAAVEKGIELEPADFLQVRAENATAPPGDQPLMAAE